MALPICSVTVSPAWPLLSTVFFCPSFNIQFRSLNRPNTRTCFAEHSSRLPTTTTNVSTTSTALRFPRPPRTTRQPAAKTATIPASSARSWPHYDTATPRVRVYVALCKSATPSTSFVTADIFSPKPEQCQHRTPHAVQKLLPTPTAHLTPSASFFHTVSQPHRHCTHTVSPPFPSWLALQGWPPPPGPDLLELPPCLLRLNTMRSAAFA